MFQLKLAPSLPSWPNVIKTNCTQPKRSISFILWPENETLHPSPSYSKLILTQFWPKEAEQTWKCEDKNVKKIITRHSKYVWLCIYKKGNHLENSWKIRHYTEHLVKSCIQSKENISTPNQMRIKHKKRWIFLLKCPQFSFTILISCHFMGLSWGQEIPG